MTETDWLECADPRALLEHVQGDVSQRKLRLFVTACCRRVWGPARDAGVQAMLALAERFAETGSLQVEKAVVRVQDGEALIDCGASEPLKSLQVWDGGGSPLRVPPSTLPPELIAVVEHLACWRSVFLPLDWLHTAFREAGLSLPRQAELFREIVRGGFRPLLVRAAWRQWNDRALLGIAEGAYNERPGPTGELDPCRLAILADALEDAGCTDADILGHLRGPGPHVRGCWALDCLTEKS